MTVAVCSMRPIAMAYCGCEGACSWSYGSVLYLNALLTLRTSTKQQTHRLCSLKRATFTRWPWFVVLCTGAEDKTEQLGNYFFFFSSSPTYADTITSNLPLMSSVGRKWSPRLLMNLDSRSSSVYNHAQTLTEVLATCVMFYCVEIDMFKT